MIRWRTLLPRAWMLGAAILMVGSAFSQTETERFDIERFVIEGNTLLDPKDIETLLKPFTGPKREYGDVQRALEALELRYRQRGYSAVQVFVPEQELGGSVKLQVIESSIRRVRIQGNDHFTQSNIRRSLPAVREGAYPNAPAISENVQLANENPAKQADVVLKGTDQEGFIDVEVNITDNSPHKVSLTFDNTGNDATGHYRAGIGYQMANVLDLDHVLSLNYITSPGKVDRVSIFSVGYRAPLYGLGDSIDFIAAKSDVDAGTTQTVAGPLQFAGKGDVFGLRYNWLLPRRGEYSHKVIFGLDLRAFKNTCLIAGAAFIGGAPACGAAGVDVSVRPLSVTYAGQWARPGSQSDFSVSYARNWRGTNSGGAVEVAAARPSSVLGAAGAPVDYEILRLGGSHTRVLERDWQFRIAASAQYTRDPLISGEQFGIAGATAVRGFSEREVARDTGYFSNVELYSPNVASTLGLDGSQIRIVGFYDIGYASNNTLAGENKQKAAIASVGIGLRWTIQKNLSIKSDFSQVVDEGGSRTRGTHRAQFSAYYAF